jgi:hypothetical protein
VKTTLASAENCCQFSAGLTVLSFHVQREKGYITQPIPMPISRNKHRDHTMYFTRSSGGLRLRNPNATEIASANSDIA